MEGQPLWEDSTNAPCAAISPKTAAADVVAFAPVDGGTGVDRSSSPGSPRGEPAPLPFSGTVNLAERSQELQGLRLSKGLHAEAEGPREGLQVSESPCAEKLTMRDPCGTDVLEGADGDCVVAEAGNGCVSTPEGPSGGGGTDIETACRETFLFANAKAGMDMTEEEKAKIAAKIFELSKNSPFFVNEMRKKKQMEEQLVVLRRRVQLFESCGGCAEASAAARRVLQLLQQQQQRESGRVYVHLDMDMFFCAVEMRDDPSLGSQPMAVGSLSMLSTANYAARRFGVRSGMPGFIAKQLCPSLTIVRPNFKKYRDAGETIRAVLQTYDPLLSSHSLDEASLDVTDYLCKRFPQPDGAALPLSTTSTQRKAEEVPPDAAAATAATDRVAALVSEIRGAVTAATGLSCSAGAASSRIVAKIASDMNKPNGQKIVEATGASAGAAASATAAFLESLNVRKIPGIGKHRERMLNAFDIHTCGELRQQAPLLLHLLPRITAVHLIRMALGIDGLPPELQQQQQTQQQQQSVSSEETFQATNELPMLRRVVEQLAAAVAKQLKELRQEGDHITLKVKFADFSVRTISHRLAYHTDDGAAIATAAQGLLHSVMREQQLKKQKNSSNGIANSKGSLKGTPTWVRLLGVRCSGFREAKARSAGLRRLDEFFSQQQQPQEQKPEAATPGDAKPLVKEDWCVDTEDLDDLLAVLSQHEHGTAAATEPAPEGQETATSPASAGFAAARPSAPTPAAKLPVATAPVAAPALLANNAPVEKTTTAAQAATAEMGAAASPGVVAAQEAPQPRTVPPQKGVPQRQTSRSASVKSNSGSSKSQDIRRLLRNATSQEKPQQRRRLASPPIHEQLMQQRRQRGRQQPQLLELLRGPSKRRHTGTGHDHSRGQNTRQEQLAGGTVVVEILSD
ncbi:Polk-prov protein, related [Eimeria brunetti]|uniref:DNA polymerase kappa n=1 Tax=Eimeria brunetti TaxID=51314 RepID=U6LST3_9EIME|nr:Polk-prov protein, related [Eimeria brunetti]